MTVPHDEQPLTRRQLRDLERQKPRKQQKEEAKAAEEAEAKRRAEEEARAAAERAAFEAEAARAVLPSTPFAAPAADAPAVPAAETAAPDARSAETTESDATAGETTAAETADAEADSVEVAPAAPGEPDSFDALIAPAAVAAATPILSRRARRALSADHPLAEQNAEPQAEAEPAEAPAEPEAAPAAGATGPIIAEIVVEEEIFVETDDDALTAETSPDSFVPEGDGADAQPMVEELMVVDEAVAPELSAEEEDELAEIDDTPAPEPVQIVTIDETPSAPILAPLFQARAAEPDREITKVDLTQASFDDLIASRGVGSSNSVASTSALVLPSVPNHGDVGTALDETGEVIITGSIDLPMSLGSTGAAPADGLESADLDAFLDPESEVGSDVAPVSATRAISTHGPSSGLVAPPKRRGANAPVILAVTAGVLAVGVVGLLLAAFVFRIF
ncbi:hypothetical protein [Subtercola lobariae]|uniref:Uncharacterized protein n=1 Tax=Subtercola lobariae TaxID=1588641 RepID=A0A917BEC9_9MICO|nr:hypothetical protein [Subtercola lobariae]GGF40024.1 hypothetical protein GCM10011399_36130 [Subtercola lobariae]